MPRQGLFLFRVSHGGGEGPFQGKQRGSRMKRRHMFRRRFFFACGCALACINGPWRNERGVRRCTSVARALLSPCAVWVPPAAKGPCGRMESQPNHRGGELGHSITLRDHLGIGTTQCRGRFRPFATYICSRQQKRMRAVSVATYPRPSR